MELILALFMSGAPLAFMASGMPVPAARTALGRVRRRLLDESE